MIPHPLEAAGCPVIVRHTMPIRHGSSCVEAVVEAVPVSGLEEPFPWFMSGRKLVAIWF